MHSIGTLFLQNTTDIPCDTCGSSLMWGELNLADLVAAHGIVWSIRSPTTTSNDAGISDEAKIVVEGVEIKDHGIVAKLMTAHVILRLREIHRINTVYSEYFWCIPAIHPEYVSAGMPRLHHSTNITTNDDRIYDYDTCTWMHAQGELDSSTCPNRRAMSSQ